MSTVQSHTLPPADQQALDRLQPVVDQLTPAGRRKLLAQLARKCLPAEGGDVSLVNDEGDVFAYLYSKNRPVLDLAAMFTKEELAAIERNLTDARNLMTLEETLALLDAEDDRRDSPP
ncbi:MAG: hypothetical protein J2P46_01930 [Zavarzinella sp.]|nr:hypothetical protein [Zavarzinella sp.]